MRRALAVVLLAACGSQQPSATSPPSPPTAVQPVRAEPPVASTPAKPIKNTTLAAVGLDPSALDRTADPCDDFYQFACGGWMARTEIPADKPMAMRSFVDIEDRNRDYLHDVLEQARKAPGDDPLLKQLGAFYGSCMDEAATEKAGVRPLRPLLAAIAKIKDTRTLSAALTTLHVHGVSGVFRLEPSEDFANATQMIAGLDQGGLGLPDRDYYLNDDDRSKALRAAYLDFAAAVLVEAGHSPAAAKTEAAEILALETEIAKVSQDKVMRRDPKQVYNKIDRAGVQKAMPHFEWDAFWKAVGLPEVRDVTVTSPEFFAGADALLVKTTPAVWRNYLTVSTLGTFADVLTKKLQSIAFALESKLTGQPELLPRWKRCVVHTDRALGDVLGQIYVRDRFGGASKTAAEDQVKAISAVMKQNLDALPWMDAATRAKAHAKLAAVAYHIGHPKRWRSYTFKIDPRTFGASFLAARRFHAAYELAKIGKPVDRDEWSMTAPTVNAYYNPLHNKMVFPAGILQPPFYSVAHSVAVNLGGMGFVVGHELTHGFDDQGAQFDAGGNMTNWWQPETAKQFAQRTQCVVDQYAGYEVTGGAKVNGKLTVGENIADIGGVKLALAAYRALRAGAPEAEVADGFTEDQQFFLSAGQVWCAKLRPEYESMLVSVDPHSPMKWRVNGTLSATPEFAKAFRCKAGAKLRPANACVVW